MALELQPSTRYRFARNPRQAIAAALVEQCNQKSTNPRRVWAAVVEAAGRNAGDALDLAAFTIAVKGLGTGIQLEPVDVQIAFGLGSDDTISLGTLVDFLERT